uniref:Uncharacterized protein n=1 Tax=Trichogramma kaykai TaxID=54128 RepID=A0ABD2XDC9_9HYME
MRVSNLPLRPMQPSAQACMIVYKPRLIMVVQRHIFAICLFAHVSPSAAAKLEQPWYPYNVANKKTIAMIYIYECPPFNSFCSYITRDDAPSEEKTTNTTQVSWVLDVLRAVMCALQHGHRTAIGARASRARHAREAVETRARYHRSFSLALPYIIYVYWSIHLCECEYGDELARASKPFEAVSMFVLQVYTFQNLKNTDSSGPRRCSVDRARARILYASARELMVF